MYGGYPPPIPPPPGSASNGAATAGFVCGLVGFLICLIPFGVFAGGIVAIVGIVFGFIGRTRAREVGTGSGMATAGAVLGIVGLIVGVVWVVVFVAFFRDVEKHLNVNSGDFTIEEDSCRTTELRTFTAIGSITNTTDFDKFFVTVNVVVHDSSGRVIGTGDDFVGTVDAHETQTYSVRDGLDASTESTLDCTVAVH